MVSMARCATDCTCQTGSIDFPRSIFSRRRRFSPSPCCLSACFLRHCHHLHCGKDIPDTMFQGVQHVFSSMMSGIGDVPVFVLHSRKVLCSACFWAWKGCFLTFFSFFVKKSQKKLAGLKIMRTFALPIQTGVLKEANNRENNKFIEKTDYCTRSKYREKYNLSRSVNSLWNYKCQDRLEI